MYTILMTDSKTLVSTETKKIYQNDSLVGNDKLQFVIPASLGREKDENGVYQPDLRDDCTCILTYKDPSNTVKTAILQPQAETISSDDVDEVYYKYYLPVTVDLTKFAGNIGISLTLINTVSDFVLHSGEYILTVNPLPTQYAVYDQSSINDTLAQINDIRKDVEDVKTTIPDDLVEEDNYVKLSIKGESIGEGVELPDTGDDFDSGDGTPNGIIDLDEDGNIDESDSDNPSQPSGRDSMVSIIDIDDNGEIDNNNSSNSTNTPTTTGDDDVAIIDLTEDGQEG